jgi:NADPH-dependent curcumin reductase CurA
MVTVNRAVRLERRPPVGPAPLDIWAIADEPLRAPVAGEVSARLRYISIEPPMRHWISEFKAGPFKPVEIGDVMRSSEAVAEVVESRTPGFDAGDVIVGSFGVQRFWVGVPVGCRKLEPGETELPRQLGVLGNSGLTAYFGLLDIGQPKPGETVVVSAAAGAVGSIAGQIARIKGCRVIGIAGGKSKCRMVIDEFGFDQCIDYKHADLAAALKIAAPQGIDIFFDNVGDAILEAALANLALKARIVLCGAIAGYNDPSAMHGPRNYMNLRMSRARMEGFVVMDYAEGFPAARREISGWLNGGGLKPREQLETGIDRFPQVMAMLFTGENFGKLILIP